MSQQSTRRICYFDHIAASRLDDDVLRAMLPFLTEEFGNPANFHSLGIRAQQAVDTARQQLAELIGARPEEIIFTASGSESNNLAIKGIAQALHRKGNHLIVSSIEHISVLNSIKRLKESGFTVDYLPVDPTGLIDPAAVERSIKPETVLISVMTANNEVGTIQPIRAISQIARQAGICLHTDAVVAVGMIPVSVDELGVDALSLAASNFHGPKGAAALYLRKGTPLRPLIDGGAQEQGRRAGTENVPAIVGMGAAAERARSQLEYRIPKIRQLRDRLVQGLLRRIPDIQVTGHPTDRLPNHASVCVHFVEGESMLLWLNEEGICAASGSSCTSRTLKVSHVLRAMGLDQTLAQGSLVMTLGYDSSEEDVEQLLARLPPIVERLRAMSPLARAQTNPQGDSRGQN